MDPIINTLIQFADLLHQSTTEVVAGWNVEFIKKSVDWCVFLETEWSLLSTEQAQTIFSKAQKERTNADLKIEEVPDALHVFFHRLLQNEYLGNDIYLYIIKNYQFLTAPEEKEILIEDMAKLAHNSATLNVLRDIQTILEEDA